MPVNHTFAAVLAAVAAHTALGQEQLRQREFPSLFVRLHVRTPIQFQTPTDQSYKVRRVTEVVAFAEVSDRSGRVLFGAFGRDRVEDEIDYGVALNAADRREIVVKNAILDLAGKFAAGLKIKSARLAITAAGEELSIRDEHGMLAPEASVRVFRSLGRVSGIADEVLVPIWEIAVTEAGDGMARARLVLPVIENAPPPKKGDLVLLDGIESHRATRARLGACGAAERLGAVDLPGYNDLALNLFASSYGAPFYLGGLTRHAAQLVSAGCGFKSGAPLREPTIDLCVQPVYRIDLAAPSCSDAGCAAVASVRLTYRLREGAGGEIRVKRGIETQMKATALPLATTTESKESSLESDLVDETLQLAPTLAASFSEEKL